MEKKAIETIQKLNKYDVLPNLLYVDKASNFYGLNHESTVFHRLELYDYRIADPTAFFTREDLQYWVETDDVPDIERQPNETPSRKFLDVAHEIYERKASEYTEITLTPKETKRLYDIIRACRIASPEAEGIYLTTISHGDDKHTLYATVVKGDTFIKVPVKSFYAPGNGASVLISIKYLYDFLRCRDAYTRVELSLHDEDVTIIKGIGYGLIYEQLIAPRIDSEGCRPPEI